MTAAADDRPWWLVERTAWCSWCSHGYAWELHVACVECDDPVCPMCLIHVHARGALCPSCVPDTTTPAASTPTTGARVRP